VSPTQPAARIARQLARLVDMGFERTDQTAVTTETVRLDGATVQAIGGRPAMGTVVSVSAVGPSADRLEEAIGRACEEMDRLIALFSRFEPASAVSQLNAAGRLEGPPPEVLRVMRRAAEYHAISGGAFDVTVAPLVDLFADRFGRDAPVAPTPAEVREALERVGLHHVAIERRRIRFARAGVAVTLDGIAKGYIVDGMARALDGRGVTRYLINAGGDIRTRGMKQPGRPWTIAVRDPSGRAAFPDTIHLADGAVATSGSYEACFDDDRAFHHIVSPETGRSPTAVASVSVVAPTAMAADALATAVFVRAPREGIALIDHLSHCACLIIDRDGRHWRSRRWTSAPPTQGDEAAS
jgi:thiamine biosynthesis lipoprotein